MPNRRFRGEAEVDGRVAWTASVASDPNSDIAVSQEAMHARSGVLSSSPSRAFCRARAEQGQVPDEREEGEARQLSV
jgi:hypothetical protein